MSVHTTSQSQNTIISKDKVKFINKEEKELAREE